MEFMRGAATRRALLGIAAAWAVTQTAPAASAARIQWAPSYGVALARAKKANKLLMVDLFTSW